MIGLDSRVGIQAFFCITRKASDFAIQPRWFFTSADLEKYLEIAVRKGWDSTKIGSLIEAFAVAGGTVTCQLFHYTAGFTYLPAVFPCTAAVLRTSKQKALWAKIQIRDKLNAKLGTYLMRPVVFPGANCGIAVLITGHAKAKMAYKNFEQDIVQRYSINLLGWPAGLKFTNPSDLSDSLPPLQALVDALNDDSCKFVQLSATELKARRERTAADIQAGTAIAHARKQRRDAGIPRGPRSKRSRTDKAVITDDSDDDDSGEGGDAAAASDNGTLAPARDHDGQRIRKRRRT